MRIFIQDFGQHYSEFVDVINDDMSRRFVLRPFHGSSVRDVAEGDGRLFCLARSQYGKQRETNTTELAVFDSTTAEEIRRSVLPFSLDTVSFLPINKLLAVQSERTGICFLKADTLERVWQSRPLFAPKIKKKWWFGWRAIAQN